jgi:imidazolonepropionase-like amidohydrolase
VKIAFGTDAGVYPMASMLKNLAMVDAGMPQLAAIQSTITNAMLLGIGSGKAKKTFSRFIAVNENPLLTISTLEKVYFDERRKKNI